MRILFWTCVLFFGLTFNGIHGIPSVFYSWMDYLNNQLLMREESKFLDHYNLGAGPYWMDLLLKQQNMGKWWRLCLKIWNPPSDLPNIPSCVPQIHFIAHQKYLVKLQHSHVSHNVLPADILECQCGGYMGVYTTFFISQNTYTEYFKLKNNLETPNQLIIFDLMSSNLQQMPEVLISS